MNKFHERVRELRDSSGDTQSKIAGEIGVTPPALSLYFNNREPSFDILVKLARYFGVSTDYLLGLSEYKNTDEKEYFHSAVSDLKVSMQGASIAVEFEEEKAMEVFGKLTETLLSVKKKETIKAPKESAACAEPVVKQEFVVLPKPEFSTVTESDLKELDKLPSLDNPKYKGFMHIKCPECGKIRDFYMKKESDHYHCDNCDARTEFEKPLALLWVNCECGGKFRYLTNMTDPLFDINCLECGAPVAVKWNENKQVYQTIK